MPSSLSGDPTKIARQSEIFQAVALTNVLATTPEIDVDAASLGAVYVPAGSPITTLTFHTAPISGGTFIPLHNLAGTAVTLTVAAGRCQPLPAECFAGGHLKIVTNAAGLIDLILKG